MQYLLNGSLDLCENWTYANKIVIDYQPNFHKDPCKACPSSAVTLLFGHRGVPKMPRNNYFGGPFWIFLKIPKIDDCALQIFPGIHCSQEKYNTTRCSRQFFYCQAQPSSLKPPRKISLALFCISSTVGSVYSGQLWSKQQLIQK